MCEMLSRLNVCHTRLNEVASDMTGCNKMVEEKNDKYRCNATHIKR